MSWRNINEYAETHEVKRTDVNWILEMKETGSKIRRFNEYLYGEEGKLTEKGGEPLKGDTVLYVESNIEVPYFNDLVKTMEKFTCKKVFKQGYIKGVVVFQDY